MADVAVMLATNGYITGQSINVNGGWCMALSITNGQAVWLQPPRITGRTPPHEDASAFAVQGHCPADWLER